MKTVRPEMEDDQYKQFLEDMFHEYFEHGDTCEVIVRIIILYESCRNNHWTFVPLLLALLIWQRTAWFKSWDYFR